MVVEVNGASLATNAKTLHELIEELGYGEWHIATALNGNFVAVARRRAQTLKEHDVIEIVTPRQGG